MSIDIDADLVGILGSETDLPRTTGMTYTGSDGSVDTIAGVLVERRAAELEPGTGVVSKVATLLVDTDEFTNNTVRSEGDTVAVSGQSTWIVVEVWERVEYVRFGLAKESMLGRSL